MPRYDVERWPSDPPALNPHPDGRDTRIAIPTKPALVAVTSGLLELDGTCPAESPLDTTRRLGTTATVPEVRTRQGATMGRSFDGGGTEAAPGPTSEGDQLTRSPSGPGAEEESHLTGVDQAAQNRHNDPPA